jgi:hypothetical protein
VTVAVVDRRVLPRAAVVFLAGAARLTAAAFFAGAAFAVPALAADTFVAVTFVAVVFVAPVRPAPVIDDARPAPAAAALAAFFAGAFRAGAAFVAAVFFAPVAARPVAVVAAVVFVARPGPVRPAVVAFAALALVAVAFAGAAFVVFFAAGAFFAAVAAVFFATVAAAFFAAVAVVFFVAVAVVFFATVVADFFATVVVVCFAAARLAGAAVAVTDFLTGVAFAAGWARVAVAVEGVVELVVLPAARFAAGRFVALGSAMTVPPRAVLLSWGDQVCRYRWVMELVRSNARLRRRLVGCAPPPAPVRARPRLPYGTDPSCSLPGTHPHPSRPAGAAGTSSTVHLRCP